MIGQGMLGVEAGQVADTSDDRYTPRWLFDAAGITFDMDVCAPVDPERRTCPARRYLTPLENGLVQGWDGVIWMNPPWSKTLPWVDRFAAHETGGLALLPATRSAATAKLMKCADSVVFLTGQFARPDGSVDHTAWLIIVAARGLLCSRGVQNLAHSRGAEAWIKASPRQPFRAGDVLEGWGDRPITAAEAADLNRRCGL